MDFYGNPVICFCIVISRKVSIPKYQSKPAIFATDLSAHHEDTLLHIATLRKLHLVKDAINLEPGETKKAFSAPRKDSDQPRHPPSLIRGFAVCSVGSL